MKTYLLEILTALTMTITVSGQVLVDEQFTRSGTGPLNGSSPSGGTLAENITWRFTTSAGAEQSWEIADAEAGTLTITGTGGGTPYIAWRPVTFSAGGQYELTMQLTVTAGGNDWVGLGLGTYNANDTPNTGWGMSGPWMMVRDNGGYSLFNLGTADNTTKTGATPKVNVHAANTLRMTLDTTGEDWTVTYYINDLATPLANYTLTDTQQTYLGPVLLTTYSGASATVDWFKLEQIPEPSTWFLLSFGLGTLILIRRRCR
ncbi:MAG: PEP-CTERM sorting domain-containing protein [Verrucomicrobiales bacterium]|jgi:hypothetical protein|nr:PEP-CTERM sorting domain-containing protein [Verrucomicrobiales bacterium]